MLFLYIVKTCSAFFVLMKYFSHTVTSCTEHLTCLNKILYSECVISCCCKPVVLDLPVISLNISEITRRNPSRPLTLDVLLMWERRRRVRLLHLSCRPEVNASVTWFTSVSLRPEVHSCRWRSSSLLWSPPPLISSFITSSAASLHLHRRPLQSLRVRSRSRVRPLPCSSEEALTRVRRLQSSSVVMVCLYVTVNL